MSVNITRDSYKNGTSAYGLNLMASIRPTRKTSWTMDNCTHMIYFDEKIRKGVFLERRRSIEKGTGVQVSSLGPVWPFLNGQCPAGQAYKGPPGSGDPPTIRMWSDDTERRI